MNNIYFEDSKEGPSHLVKTALCYAMHVLLFNLGLQDIDITLL